MKYADLHVHSHYSDGSMSPQEIVAVAVKAGLACVSITDHDNTDGLDQAKEAAQEALEIIPGIEMTAESNGEEIHILGYLMDYKDPAFAQMMASMQAVRVERIHGICKRLKKLGVILEPDEIFRLATKGSVGRLHVARALCAAGHVGSVSEAFARFIGERAPAYVGKFRMTPKEVIGWIIKYKGIPVLAHPCTLSDKSLISDFVKAGIMGIEVYYTEHSPYQTQEFLKMAQKHDLLVTGGSDCHGAAKEDVYLGRIRLPYEHVEKLKEAQCHLP